MRAIPETGVTQAQNKVADLQPSRERKSADSLSDLEAGWCPELRAALFRNHLVCRLLDHSPDREPSDPTGLRLLD